MDRRLLVGGAGNNKAMDMLHAPIVFHQLHREPVEKIGMRGTRALQAKIFGSFEKTDAKIGLPNSIHKGAGGGGCTRIDKPTGKSKAGVGRAVGK